MTSLAFSQMWALGSYTATSALIRSSISQQCSPTTLRSSKVVDQVEENDQKTSTLTT